MFVWHWCARRQVGGFDVDPGARTPRLPLQVSSAGKLSSVQFRVQAVYSSLLCQSDDWHPVRVTASGNEVLHNHRTPHRLHGWTISGQWKALVLFGHLFMSYDPNRSHWWVRTSGLCVASVASAESWVSRLWSRGRPIVLVKASDWRLTSTTRAKRTYASSWSWSRYVLTANAHYRRSLTAASFGTIFGQYVEFFIERGVLGLSKEVNHTVLEYRGEPVLPCQKWRFDSANSFVVPVMPPTLVGICRLLQIYYVLKVSFPQVWHRTAPDSRSVLALSTACVQMQIWYDMICMIYRSSE